MKITAVAITLFALSAALFAAQNTVKWDEKDIIQPEALHARLADGKQAKPVILMVGFNNLYKSTHIPGAEFAGPAFNPEGLEILRKAVAKVPKDRDIVIYCGCCPWDHCPNVRPAVELLHGMGFKNVRAMVIEKNLEVDWIKKGFPVQSGDNGQ